MFSQPIAQWLGKLRVVEDADLTRVQVVGHCLRVAKVWNRSLDDQPVVAAEDAHDLIGKSVGKQLRTHSMLPPVCAQRPGRRLLNSSRRSRNHHPTRPTKRPFWFRLRRVRILIEQTLLKSPRWPAPLYYL